MRTLRCDACVAGWCSAALDAWEMYLRTRDKCKGRAKIEFSNVSFVRQNILAALQRLFYCDGCSGGREPARSRESGDRAPLARSNHAQIWQWRHQLSAPRQKIVLARLNFVHEAPRQHQKVIGV